MTTGQDQSFTVYYLNNYESLIRHTSGKFNIKTSENANDVIAVDVVCPDSVVVYDSFKIVGDSQWLSHDKIATDLASICKKLNIEINRTKYERSELNVKYPADSVFANFERTLEGIRPNEIIQTTDIEKSKNFWLTHGDKRLQVAISVFPYRQGSKVIYGFFYPYAIKGDGTHTYSAAEIADIHRAIESIAND